MHKTVTTLATSVALVMLTGSAFADGMITSAAPAVTSVTVANPCAGGRFGGTYIGANLGFVAPRSDTVERVLVGASLLNETETSFAGGVQAGYNRQCGSALFGVEGDLNFSSFKSDTQYTLAGILPAPLVNDERRMDWFGTLRTRAGIVANDTLLLYVTGGLAFAEIKHKVDSPLFNFTVFDNSKLRWGWTVGAGAEMDLGRNLSLKTEALYLQFQNNDFGVAQAPTVRFSDRDSAWVGRIGLNYKFGDRVAVDHEPMK